MKLQFDRDFKKTAEKEPEFPKIVYYLLSVSLALFLVLTVLAFRPINEDAEEGHGSVIQEKKISASQKNRRNLPEVILMGSCGTGLGLLKEVLEDHPSLKFAPHNVRFFEDRKIFNKGLYWYQNEMPETYEGQLTVDVAPEIFVSAIAIQRISLMLPDAKFIVTVRDPVDRIIAEYIRQMHYSKLPASTRRIWTQEPSPHFDLSKEVILGRYSVFYRRWLQHFQQRQFLIVSYEKLVNQPTRELKRIEKFLGVRIDNNATDNAALRARELAKQWQNAVLLMQKDTEIQRIKRMKTALRFRYTEYVLDLIRLTGDTYYKKWL